MPLYIFDFVIAGPPFSANSIKDHSTKHRAWKSRIREAAEHRWNLTNRQNCIANDADVTVNIQTYFTAEPTDVDNVIKPILDALGMDGDWDVKRRELENHKNKSKIRAQLEAHGKAPFYIYFDDRQVVRVVSERIDLNVTTFIDVGNTFLVEYIDNKQWAELVYISIEWESEEQENGDSVSNIA